MGVMAKKAMMKKLQKGSAQLVASESKSASADFLPLEGGPGRRLANSQPLDNKATILYIGRIPHGFYENEMEGFFKQFGTIRRLRLARNKKTGKSKHFGFIEFESPEVAKIVAESMHNYLLFEHMLQVQIISPECVHPKLWKGVSKWYKPLDWVRMERKRHDKAQQKRLLGNTLRSCLDAYVAIGSRNRKEKKERMLEDHKKLVERILKQDKKRRKNIEAAGIDYECPGVVGCDQPAPKKIRFDDE